MSSIIKKFIQILEYKDPGRKKAVFGNAMNGEEAHISLNKGCAAARSNSLVKISTLETMPVHRTTRRNRTKKIIPETFFRESEDEGVFSKKMEINISKIQRNIKDKSLVIEILPLGKLIKSSCCLIYLDDFADPEAVSGVREDINRVNYDIKPCRNITEKILQNNPMGFCPQALKTEHVLTAASSILAGKVAVLIEGFSTAVVVPVTFWDLVSFCEECSGPGSYLVFIRSLKLMGLIAAVFTPGIYLALMVYQPEVLPTDLLINVSFLEEKQLLPTITGLIIIEIIFELTKLISLRFPTSQGFIFDTVGFISLGFAAACAQLISPLVILVTATNWFDSVITTNYSLYAGIKAARYIFIFLAILSGFYGIASGIFSLFGLMCSIKTYGVPFLSFTKQAAKA